MLIIRKPSIKKSIKLRTAGKVRQLRSKGRSIPFMVKGMGIVNDPKGATARCSGTTIGNPACKVGGCRRSCTIRFVFTTAEGILCKNGECLPESS